MRELSPKEFDEAPTLVKFIYWNAIAGTPMGSKLLEEGYEKHPEYFPDEVEHRRRWALVPPSVHEAYHAAYWAITSEMDAVEPKAVSGIYEWINDPETFIGLWNAHDKAVEALGLDKRREDLYDLHYGPYMNG